MKVAVCAFCKNEIEYIAEWVAYHKILGFDDIFIYDNASTDGTSEFLVSMELFGALRRIYWPHLCFYNKGGNYHHWVPQRTAYAHFIQTFSRKYSWVAIIDMDEFIVLYDSSTIQEFLSRIDALHPNIASISVPWLCFGTSGNKNKQEGLVIERFLNCDSFDDIQYHPFNNGSCIKTIFKPSKTAVMRTHHCEIISGMYVDNTMQQASFCGPDALCYPVSQGSVLIHHYVTKSEEEFYSRSVHVLGGRMPLHRKYALEVLSTLPNSNTSALRHVDSVKKEIDSLLLAVELKGYQYLDVDMDVVISGGHVVIIKTINLSPNTDIRVVLNDNFEIYTQNNLILHDGSNGFSIDIQYYCDRIIKISASVVGSTKVYVFLADIENYYKEKPSLKSHIIIKNMQLPRIKRVKNILKYTPSMERLLFHSMTRIIMDEQKFIKILNLEKQICGCFLVRKEFGDLLYLIFSIYLFPERIGLFCHWYVVKHPNHKRLLMKYLNIAMEHLYIQDIDYNLGLLDCVPYSAILGT